MIYEMKVPKRPLDVSYFIVIGAFFNALMSHISKSILYLASMYCSFFSVFNKSLSLIIPELRVEKTRAAKSRFEP